MFVDALYPCSLCGKEGSANDWQPFCGPCTIKHYEELERERAEDRRVWAASKVAQTHGPDDDGEDDLLAYYEERYDRGC